MVAQTGFEPGTFHFQGDRSSWCRLLYQFFFTRTTFWALCHSQLLSLEKVENCDDFYAKYDQLNHEADKINVDNGQYMTFPESYLRLGNLYKDMYKLAKEKKTSKVISE